MKSALLIASIAMLAAAASAPSLASAGDSRSDSAARSVDRLHDDGERGMRAVGTSAGPGESGHGWRYFSDPAAQRAVVISPQGEYYYSRGKGLRLVAVTQPAP
jgi:hypothetical protein